MKGSSHVQIAVASAVTVAALMPATTTVLAVTTIPAIGIISSAAGGLFADIDHEHSKYGRKLKQFRDVISTTGRIITVIGMALLSVNYFGLINTPLFAPFYLLSLAAGIILMALGYMSGLLKHRGIAHTLLFPAAMTAVYYVIGYKYSLGVVSVVLCSLIFGFNIGYVSHILADSLNGKGVPLLWPLSPSRIRFLDIAYGGMAEKAVIMLTYGVALFCVIKRFIGCLG